MGYNRRMTRRELSICFLPPLFSRRAKAQTTSLAFNVEISRGDVRLLLFKEQGHLWTAVRCLDKNVSLAIVTAFYRQKVKLSEAMPWHSSHVAGEETELLRAQVRIAQCVNPDILCGLDPFDFPVDTLAFIHVETARTASKYEFKPE